MMNGPLCFHISSVSQVISVAPGDMEVRLFWSLKDDISDEEMEMEL